MKDPVRISFDAGGVFILGKPFSFKASPAHIARVRAMRLRGSDLLPTQERSPLPGVALPQGCAMPIWLEILVNVLGYGGFLAIASFHKSSEDTDPSVTPGDRG